MFHWLSGDIVRFKIEVGVEEKTTHAKWSFLQHGVHAVPLMTPLSWPTLILQRLALKYTIMA